MERTLASQRALEKILSLELLLEIISFSNAVDLAQWAKTCRMMNVLVCEAQRQASYVAVNGPLHTLPSRALKKSSVCPSMGFLFASPPVDRDTLATALRQLPKGLELIGGGTRYPFASQQEHAPPVDADMLGRGRSVLSLAHLPEARATSFLLTASQLRACRNHPQPSDGGDAALIDTLGLKRDADYRVFVILSAADGRDVDHVLKALQQAYPNSAIVGGVVQRSVFARSADGSTAFCERGGLVGLGLAGNVPLQAVVSRGVVPLSPSLPVTSWAYLEQDGGLLVVRRLRSGTTGDAPEMHAVQALMEYESESGYVGVCEETPGATAASAEPDATAQQGETSTRHFVIRDYVLSQNHDLVIPSRRPPEGAQLSLRFFDLRAEACLAHVQGLMQSVVTEIKAKNQQLLGGLMFTCNARGPRSFLDIRNRPDVDGTAFMDTFPGIPLTGFYAGGEIGPQAMFRDDVGTDCGSAVAAGSQQTAVGESTVEEEEEIAVVRRCSQTGDVALQGYTAVFGMFIVPRRVRTDNESRIFDTLSKDGVIAAYQALQDEKRREHSLTQQQEEDVKEQAASSSNTRPRRRCAATASCAGGT